MATEREPRTHDFGPGFRGYGHDYCIGKVTDGGRQVRASGWGWDGRPIEVGDYLLLQSPDGQRATRYQVASIERVMDPPDMWHAELTFAPRQYATAEEKANSR